MKYLPIVLISTLSLTLIGCSSNTNYDSGYEKGYNDGYDKGYDEGYSEGEFSINDDDIDYEKQKAYESGYEVGQDDYSFDLEYDGLFGFMRGYMVFMEEAHHSDTNSYQQLFEICDEVGYYPSILMGEYCIDEVNNIIHLTDSECIEKIDKSTIESAITYNVFNENSLESFMQNNTKFTLCPICIE